MKKSVGDNKSNSEDYCIQVIKIKGSKLTDFLNELSLNNIFPRYETNDNGKYAKFFILKDQALMFNNILARLKEKYNSTNPLNS